MSRREPKRQRHLPDAAVKHWASRCWTPPPNRSCRAHRRPFRPCRGTPWTVLRVARTRMREDAVPTRTHAGLAERRGGTSGERSRAVVGCHEGEPKPRHGRRRHGHRASAPVCAASSVHNGKPRLRLRRGRRLVPARWWGVFQSGQRPHAAAGHGSGCPAGGRTQRQSGRVGGRGRHAGAAAVLGALRGLRAGWLRA